MLTFCMKLHNTCKPLDESCTFRKATISPPPQPIVFKQLETVV